MTDTRATGTSSHKVYTQLGVLTEDGFVETSRTSQCWACPKSTNKRKPGVQRDIWRCECGTEWSTPVSET